MVPDGSQAERVPQQAGDTSPRDDPPLARQEDQHLPHVQQDEPIRYPNLRTIWVGYMQLSMSAWDTLLASWATSTAKAYEGAVKRWLTFTAAHGIHPLAPTVIEAVNTLCALALTL